MTPGSGSIGGDDLGSDIFSRKHESPCTNVGGKGNGK